MFLEINGLAYNLMFTQSIDKLDEDGKYKILYAISNENKLVEEFDNEADRDAKYELAQKAGSTTDIEGEIKEIQDDVAHLKEVGFHPLKVDELPTEDIKDYILYLVPSDDPEEENLCYEYLYINNAWEMVGTTSVDLSNYYTKSETDNTIDTKLKARPPVLSVNPSTFVLQGKKPGVYNITSNSDSVVIRVTPNSSSWTVSLKDKTLYVVKEFNSVSELGTGEMLLHYFEYNGNTLRKAKVSYDPVYQPGRLCQIFYDNVATFAFQSDLSNYLSKTNTTSFTPTADYHPATKKYVDDSMSIPTLTILPSQMISETECQLTQEQIDLLGDDSIGTIYLIGENLNMLDGVVNKSSIYESGGEQIVTITSLYPTVLNGNETFHILNGICNLTTGIAELSIPIVLHSGNEVPFTPLGDYEPATKKYVDENSGKTTLLDLTFFSPSKVDGSQQAIIASSNTQFNIIKGIMDKVKAGETPSVMVKCKFYRPKFPYNSSSTPVLTTQIIPVTMFEVISGKAYITISIPNTYSTDAVLQGLNRSITTYHISDYDSFLGGYNVQYSNESTKLRPAYLDEVLSTKFTNGTYTPINDYDPATKKYVDDNAGGSVPLYNIRLTGINFLPTPGAWNRYTFDSTDTGLLKDVIDDAYSNGYSNFILQVEIGSAAYVFNLVHFDVSSGLQSKPSYLECESYGNVDYYASGELTKLQIINLSTSISWSGDTCSLSNAYLSVAAPGVLTTENTEAFTPSFDYHPATKKYVDDIAAPFFEEAPVDSQGNLDWQQFPVNKWLALPRDKKIGHYDEQGTFVPEQRGYNITNGGAAYTDSDYYPFRLIILSTNKKYREETGDTSYSIYVRFFALFDVVGLIESSSGKTQFSYSSNSTQWTEYGNLPLLTGIYENWLVSEETLRHKDRLIYGQQTFNKLPKSTATPTTDDHLTNKKYVDDTVTIKAYQLAGLTEYNSASTYNTGDYCYYQNAIYKCNDDNITGGWDSTKWDSKTYLEYLQDAVVGSALGGSY